MKIYLAGPDVFLPDALLIGQQKRDICERHGVTLPEAALAFPLRHRSVVSVVVGVRTPEQLTSTVDRYGASIPEGLWAELSALELVRGAKGE